jgi:hypothetical protein
VNRTFEWLTTRVRVASEAYRPNARALGILRILFALSIIVRPTDVLWTRGLPSAFYNPGPGLQELLTTVPPDWISDSLQLALYVSAVWLLIGWKTSAASIVTFVVSIAASTVVFSFSKVDHTIFYQLVPIVLAAAGWGTAFSVDAKLRKHPAPKTDGFPLVVLSVLLAFGWATASAAKWAGGWWKPGNYGSWSYVASDYVLGERPGVLAKFALDHSDPAMWKLIDYATLFAEGWLVVALFSPRLFRVALLILPVFHLSVFLMLDIHFETYAFVYAAFFLTAPRNWFRRPDRPPRRSSESVLPGTAASG